MDKKTIAFMVTYGIVTGIKGCMDKVAEVAIMTIIKSKLPL